MKILYTLLISLLLLVGCSETETEVTDTSKNSSENTKLTIPAGTKSANGIFTIGDEKELIAGDNITLEVNKLDTAKEFVSYEWLENGDIIGSDEKLILTDLPIGTHYIVCQMRDKEGNIFADVVTINVKFDDNTNHPPVAESFDLTLDEDTPVITHLRGSDEDGDALTYSYIKTPTKGTLSGSTVHLKYTPKPNATGSDNFTYVSNDGHSNSKVATVNIDIRPINDAPIFSSTPITKAIEDVEYSYTIKTNDPDNDKITITANKLPTWLSLNNNTLIGTPTSDSVGKTEDVTISITDNFSQSITQAFSIYTKPNPKVKLLYINDIVLSEDDTTYSGTLKIENETFIDDTNLTYTAQTVKGFSIENNKFSFDPSLYQSLNEGEIKTLTVLVEVDAQPSNQHDEQNITIVIDGKNDAPVLTKHKIYQVDENSSISIDLNDIISDIDHNDKINLISSSVDDNNGSVSFETNGTITFSTLSDFDNLNKDKNKTINLNYTIKDNYGATFSSQLEILVNGINNPLILNNQREEVTTTNNVKGNLNITDIDNNNFTYTTENILLNILSDGRYEFKATDKRFEQLKKDENISYDINITIKDDLNTEYNVTLPFTVIGINDAPVAVSDEYNLIESNYTMILDVLENDTDIDNSSEIFITDIGSQPELGNVYISDDNKSIIFSSNNDFENLSKGEEKVVKFTYKIKDEYDSKSSGYALVTLHINGENDAPDISIPEEINININDSLVIAPDIIRIDKNSSIITYSWLLDNNEISTDNSLNYSNISTGKHTLELLIKDDRNISTTKSIDINVKSEVIINGNYTKMTLSSLSEAILQIEVDDLDTDGDMDILVRSATQIGWYMNKGNNQVSNFIPIAQTASTMVKVGNIDGGEYPEIVYIDENNLQICNYNDTTLSFSCRKVSPKEGTISSIDVTSNRIYFSVEKSAYFYDLSSTDIKTLTTTDNTIKSIKTDDINHDGLLDYVIMTNTEFNRYIYNNNTDSYDLITVNIDATTEQNFTSFDIAQIEAEGYLDIFTTSNGINNNGEVYWSTIEESSNNKNIWSMENEITNPQNITAVDMDGDGDIDALTNEYKMGGRVLWFDNNGYNNAIFTIKTLFTTDYLTTAVRAVDYDNDGDMDIITASDDGDIRVYLDNKTPTQISIPTKNNQTNNTQFYTRDNDIVTQTQTGLSWQDNKAARDEIEYTATQAQCRDLTLGGLSWRIPNKYELYYLITVDKEDKNDKYYISSLFENIYSTTKIIFDMEINYSAYWNTSNQVYTDFIGGQINSNGGGDKTIITLTKFARCVSGKEIKFNYIHNDTDDSVIDKIHGLVWDDSTKASSYGTYNVAQNGCTYPWRLPTINELYSITSNDGMNPAFKNTKPINGVFNHEVNWWSSTLTDDNLQAYVINITDGSDASKDLEDSYNYRCVKDLN